MGTFLLPFNLRMNKFLLLLGNILAGVIFIVLQNQNIFPQTIEYFAFFSFVVFLFALYRPGWAFLFFVGMIPYEIIEVTQFGAINLRPYQWLAVLLLFAVSLRFVLGKLPFKLFRPQLIDLFPVFIFIGALLSAFFTPLGTGALKQAIVLGSFTMIYFLARIFLRTLTDVRQIIPFFLSSGFVIFCYSIWQNVRFLNGQSNFEVMAGRPNGTFSEADWLGVFTLFVLTILWALSIHIIRRHEDVISFRKRVTALLAEPLLWGLFFFETLAFIVLLIGVTRSAWLGAMIAFIFIFCCTIFSRHLSPVQAFLRQSMWFASLTLRSFLLAIIIVYVGHLTSFNLFQRAASTTHGLQKITVACVKDIVLPEKIETIEELSQFDCRHIQLEEKTQIAESGQFVKEVFRNDPNVSIRRDTYGQVWQLIMAHPVTGIGWGNVATFLGSDERGAALNASNIFLEVWLGSGIVGFLGFIFWWLCILFFAIKKMFSSDMNLDQTFVLFVSAAWIALSVFNFFNSGILLGFFFIFLALGSLVIEREAGILVKKNQL